jgi:predicted MFS family arabinose efflux permease
VRPFLETVTHVRVSTLSLVLFGIGVAGFIGTAVIGKLLKHGLYRTLGAIPVLMAAIALMLIPFGGRVASAASLLGAWGLMGTAAPVGWWTWVARALPDNGEAGGGLMVAVIQLAIALGSAGGGLLFDGSGYQATFIASAAVLLLAAFLVVLAARSQPTLKGLS